MTAPAATTLGDGSSQGESREAEESEQLEKQKDARVLEEGSGLVA